MGDLEPILRAEIERSGPLPFRRFMERALYHPEHGYYASGRDPFGKGGDFYTAEQIQPVFGRLIAQALEDLRGEMGEAKDFSVVELGAGRGEMEPYLAHLDYHGIDVGRGEWPERLRGAFFANEFFDALPVDAARRGAEGFREMRVGWDGGRFRWVEGPELEGDDLRYALANACDEEGAWVEIPRGAFTALDRIAAVLSDGYLLVIDYGCRRPERNRFPRGTLMSYRGHQAFDDVLAEPGQRDITAHVPFDALMEHAGGLGLEMVRLESMTSYLLRAGERDRFARALEAPTEKESTRMRLQLKTLLFGMGETFRVALWRKRL